MSEEHRKIEGAFTTEKPEEIKLVSETVKGEAVPMPKLEKKESE
jgi:hypothetical protein